MINLLVTFIIRHNKWLLAATAVMVVTFSPAFAHIHIGRSYVGFFPPKSDPEHIFLDRVGQEFGGDNDAIIAIVHDSIFAAETLERIRTVTQEIEQLPAVQTVLSLTNANIIKSEHDELYFRNISEHMPTSREEVVQFRQDIMDNPLYVDSLISRDGETTLIIAAVERDGPQEILTSSIQRIRSLAAEWHGPEEAYADGIASLSTEIFEMVSSDLKIYLPLTLVFVVGILFIVFRSGWSVLLPLLSIVIAIVCTYSIMAMVDIRISALTAMLPPIIAALGISYSIHLFAGYFRQKSMESDSRGAMEKTLKNILLAIWLSAITTAIGFASLTLVNVTAVRQLGFFLVSGVMFVLLLITFFVPAASIRLFDRRGAMKEKPRPAPRRFRSALGDIFRRYRAHVVIVTIVLVVLSIVGFFRIDVETDPYHYFRAKAPMKHAMDVIAKRLRSIANISIIIESPRESGIEDYELLKSIEELQNILNQQPTVGKTISVVDYLKLVNKSMHDNDPAYYVLPRSGEEIAQYLLVYSLADAQRTLDEYIDLEHRMARIEVRTSLTSSAAILNFRNFIDEQCARLFGSDISWKATGEPILVGITAQTVLRGIIMSFGLAATAISVIMVLLFRSVKMGLVAMVPNILPLVFILGFMGWANIQFNVATSLVVCVAIGIAVDDTIHFLVRYFYELKKTNHYLIRSITGVKITDGQRQAIATTMGFVSRPIVMTSIAIFLGFIVLGFSQFIPMSWFGILTAITMVYCLLCDLIILPVLLTSISL